MSAVHHFVSFNGGQTLCGIYARKSPRTDSEADTRVGGRIEIVGGTNTKATCKRCLKQAPNGIGAFNIRAAAGEIPSE